MTDLLTGEDNKLFKLLSFFPVAKMKEYWDLSGTQEELIFQVIKNQNENAIFDFVDTYFGICKQHISIYYVKGADIRLDLLPSIPGCLEIPLKDHVSSRLYILTVLVDVYLKTSGGEAEATTVEYSVPVKLTLSEGFLVVRFITLERKYGALFPDKDILTIVKADHEAGFKDRLPSAFADIGASIKPADLHKGVKELWNDDIIDATTVNYKTPDSTDTKRMDQNKGLKTTSFEVYKEVIKAPLSNCIFTRLDIERARPSTATINATDGTMSFSRFSELAEDSDEFINKIIQRNK